MENIFRLEGLNKKFKKHDVFIIDFLIFFVFIPIFLIVVFNSPLNEIFKLQTSHPKLISIYFSNFAHFNSDHLYNNISSYVIYISLIFFIPKKNNEFHFDMLLIFGLLPFIASFFNILYLPEKNAIGFSGIVAALAAYLFYSSFVYIQEKWDLHFKNPILIPLIPFGFITAIIFAAYGLKYHNNTEPMIVLFLIITLFNALYSKSDLHIIAVAASHSWRKFKTDIKIKSMIKLYMQIIVFLFILFGYITLFPKKLITENGSVNILGHYIGYFFGLVVPLFIRENRLTSLKYIKFHK